MWFLIIKYIRVWLTEFDWHSKALSRVTRRRNTSYRLPGGHDDWLAAVTSRVNQSEWLLPPAACHPAGCSFNPTLPVIRHTLACLSDSHIHQVDQDAGMIEEKEMRQKQQQQQRICPCSDGTQIATEACGACLATEMWLKSFKKARLALNSDLHLMRRHYQISLFFYGAHHLVPALTTLGCTCLTSKAGNKKQESLLSPNVGKTTDFTALIGSLYV